MPVTPPFCIPCHALVGADEAQTSPATLTNAPPSPPPSKFSRNQVLWSRVEKALPEPVARALGCVFEQHMTDPRTVNGDASSHSHSTGTLRRAYSPHTPSLSAVAAVAAATTLAGNGNPPEDGLPSFIREHSGEREGKTALARVVAEGAAASQQEEEKQAASRERTRRKDGEEEVVMGVTVKGGRRSPEGDGCAVM